MALSDAERQKRRRERLKLVTQPVTPAVTKPAEPPSRGVTDFDPLVRVVELLHTSRQISTLVRRTLLDAIAADREER